MEPATICDHVEPHRGDINKFWLGKLQSLCKPCHDGAKREIELNGLSPRHRARRLSARPESSGLLARTKESPVDVSRQGQDRKAKDCKRDFKGI